MLNISPAAQEMQVLPPVSQLGRVCDDSFTHHIGRPPVFVVSSGFFICFDIFGRCSLVKALSHSELGREDHAVGE